MKRHLRVDAPFWAFVLFLTLSLASLGCLGVAAAQHASTSWDAPIVTTDFACPPPADI